MGMAHWTVKVNGADMGADFAGALIDVLVESSIHEPDLIILSFTDLDQTVLDGSTLKPGKTLDVLVQTDDASAVSLAKGEITATEFHFEADKRMMTVRALDKGHRLMRGRKTKNRENVKISDIVSEIASANGLTGTVDTTSETYVNLHQGNTSDWEHLKLLALLAGGQVTVAEDKLIFKVLPKAEAAVVSLKLGENLHELRASMNAADVVDSVEVRSWDPKTKAALVGTASSSDYSQASKIGLAGAPASLKSDFGAAKLVVSDVSVPSQDAATTLAKSVMGIVSSSFAELEGVCDGNAKLVAGKTIKIEGCGTKLAGTHVITSARHIWNAVDNYRTTVTVSGRQNRSVLGLVTGGPGNGHNPLSHYAGVVTGIVSQNKPKDADGSWRWGMVKVKFPWMDDTAESCYARLATPMAGNGTGLQLIPEVNDEVVVAFEHGDLNYPMVLGSLWNGKDIPPLANSIIDGSGKVNTRQFKSRSGSLLTFTEKEDSSKGETITLTTSDTHYSLLLDAKNKKLVITSTDSGTIEVTADKDITVTSNQGKLTLSAQQDVSIESKTGGVTIKGMKAVSLESSAGNFEAAGLQAKMTGKTGATVDGGPQAAVKGAMVKLGP